jgi:methyl-accepting chemotaxis protein
MTTYTTRFVSVAEDRGQRVPWLNSMQIWLKLIISLGTLVALIVLVVLVTQLESASAGQKMRSIDGTRLPAVVASSRTQADLLRMSGDLQAYLALGQPAYRDSYANSAAAVAADLTQLTSLSTDFDAVDKQHLSDLKAAFDRWTKLPDRLFALHDNRPGAGASDQSRQDLNVFQDKATPLAGQMLGILDQTIADQQEVAHGELSQGIVELSTARWTTLVAGLVAILFGLGMFFFLRDSIGGPIRRLIGVAEQVRTGDLAAQAADESHDEIGTLAETFNRMTRQLRRTLLQTR